MFTRRLLEDAVQILYPCAEPGTAARLLQELVDRYGAVSQHRPAWMHEQTTEPWEGVPRWVVCGDVAILVQYAQDDPDVLLACTLVAKGHTTPQARAARSEDRRRRKGYRKAKREQDGRHNGGPSRRQLRDQRARLSDSRRDPE
jgi:hypothetical protein